MDDERARGWVSAAQAGDEAAFGRLVEWIRPELVVHCYRLLGRYDDAEDATQDALMRAWRGLSGFAGDSQVRTWLYRIATNVCLDRRTTAARRRAILAAGTVQDGTVIPVAVTVPWLQALPDEVLDAVDERSPDHADRLTSRETVELALIAALQHLSPRQRAVFVLRDVVGWSAHEVAVELGSSVSAVSALATRARRVLRQVLDGPRETWPSPSRAVEDDVVRRYVAAVEAGNDDAIAALLSEDVVVGHQPSAAQAEAVTGWYSGRETAVASWAPALHGPPSLQLTFVPTRVNRLPALACYARLPGDTVHRAFGLDVLHIDDDGRVSEITVLTPDQFGHLGLADRLTTPVTH